MAEPNGVDSPRQGVQDIANLTLDGKREAATTALQSLGSSGADVKKEVATTALQTLGINDVGAKAEVATTVLQTLGPNAVDAKKEIATTAVQTLGANAVDAKRKSPLQYWRPCFPKIDKKWSDSCRDRLRRYRTEYGSGWSAPSPSFS